MWITCWIVVWITSLVLWVTKKPPLLRLVLYSVVGFEIQTAYGLPTVSYRGRYSYLFNRFSSNCPKHYLSTSTSILNYRNQLCMTLTNSTQKIWKYGHQQLKILRCCSTKNILDFGLYMLVFAWAPIHNRI